MEQGKCRKSETPCPQLPQNHISLWLNHAKGFRGETTMQKNQPIYDPQITEKPGIAKAGRRLRASLSLMVLLILGLSFAALPPSASASAQKLADNSRRVRVNAASIAQLPTNKPYVIDLKQKGVVYDFELSGGRINYSRVVVRTETGDQPIVTFISKKFRDDAIRGWVGKRVRLTVFAAKSPAKGGLGLKNPTGKNPFTCNPIWCSCQGDDDCNDMFTTNVCGDTAFCVDTSSPGVKCYCERP
jgi:hypothetical protein